MRDLEGIRVVAKSGTSEYLDARSVRSLIARCVQYALRRLPQLPAAVDVDDLVQETLFSLWRRQQERGRPYVPSYVARAARSVLIDFLRHAGAKKRSASRTVELANAGEVCEPAVSAEERLIADERLDDLLVRLSSSVPPRSFEALRLSCLEGLTTHEAAARMGLSASGVATALHRARRAVSGRTGPRTRND